MSDAMNPVVAKIQRADGTIVEVRGQVVVLFGMPVLHFDDPVACLPGDTLHLEPIVKAEPPSARLQ